MGWAIIGIDEGINRLLSEVVCLHLNTFLFRRGPLCTRNRFSNRFTLNYLREIFYFPQ